MLSTASSTYQLKFEGRAAEIKMRRQIKGERGIGREIYDKDKKERGAGTER